MTLSQDDYAMNRQLHNRPYVDPQGRQIKLLVEWIDNCWKFGSSSMHQGPCFVMVQGSGVGKTKTIMQLAKKPDKPYWVMHIDCSDSELIELMRDKCKSTLQDKQQLCNPETLKLIKAGKDEDGESMLLSMGLHLLGCEFNPFVIGFMRYVASHQDSLSEGQLKLCYPESATQAEEMKATWREIMELAKPPFELRGLGQKLRNKNFIICFDNASALYEGGKVDIEHSLLYSAIRKGSKELQWMFMDDMSGARFAYIFVDTNPNIQDTFFNL